MIRTLQSPWLAAVIGVLLYGAITALLLRPSRLIIPGAGPAAGAARALVEPLGPSWAFKNPEVDQLVSELRTEREVLRAREKELQDYAARLTLERQEISSITQRVATLQLEMDRTIVRIRDEESANLKRLAKVYATMAPEAAAKIMVEFQDEAAVKIFAFMKDSETAPILENISKSGPPAARRVALISDRLRLLSVPPTQPAPDRPKSP